MKTRGKKKVFGRILLALVCVAVVIVSAYAIFGRQWMLRMGSTTEELAAQMPGDYLLDSAAPHFFTYQQAVTIAAPPQYAWPYIVQMGYQRGGWYNLDFINNASAQGKYFYENGKSADRVILELQTLNKGDLIYLVPDAVKLEVNDLKQDEYLLLRGGNDTKTDVTWAYVLKPVDETHTRLIVRWREVQTGDFMAHVMNKLIVEPGGAGVQQALNIRGIASRAERDFRAAGK